MSNLSTFSSKLTDRKITLSAYTTRPILRIAGTSFIIAGLYAMLYYLPYHGGMISSENIALTRIMSFAGIITGFLAFYRKRIILDKDSDTISITRDILFRLSRKQMPLSAYDSLYLTYQTYNEDEVVPGDVNPSVFSLYTYQLYLRSSDDEQLLVELQESSAPFNNEPYRCLFKIDKLARDISALTGKSMEYTKQIQEYLHRRAEN